MNTVTTISVATTLLGSHFWPDAPMPVEMLRNPHLHNFTFTLEIEVAHDDREIEFYLLREWLTGVAKALGTSDSPLGVDFGRQSCEDLANRMLAAVDLEWAAKYGAFMQVTVAEDSSQSATVKRLQAT